MRRTDGFRCSSETWSSALACREPADSRRFRLCFGGKMLVLERARKLEAERLKSEEAKHRQVPGEQPVDLRERVQVLGTAHQVAHDFKGKSFNCSVSGFNGLWKRLEVTVAQEAAFTPARSERFQTPPPSQVQDEAVPMGTVRQLMSRYERGATPQRERAPPRSTPSRVRPQELDFGMSPIRRGQKDPNGFFPHLEGTPKLAQKAL